jgi:hypothetical protein
MTRSSRLTVSRSSASSAESLVMSVRAREGPSQLRGRVATSLATPPVPQK